MADVRSNLGYIIGSVIAGAGVFVSWFFESGLLATVVGIIIGAIVAFWAQIRTQKIAWKREYSIKSVELVYSPLYGLIKDLIAKGHA